MLRIIAALTLASSCFAADLEGLWQGALQTPGGKLRLGLTVRKSPQGYAAALDSIDQGARGIPVDEITLYADTVKFSMKRLNATFEGKIDEANRTIDGTFTQAAPIPLKFERVEKFDEISRPQEPKPPFPYSAEDVFVMNALVNIRLAGTLTKPQGPGPFPALVLLTGSGPQNRNEELAGHRPFLVLSDFLTRRGYAVLRLDDRGVGGSAGNVMLSTLDELAQDARAAVQFLKARPDIVKTRIGLLGHSEGAIVAPLAATTPESDIAFLVLLAAPVVPGRDVMLRQNMEILKKANAPQAAVDQQLAFLQSVIQIVAAAPDTETAKKNLEPIIEKIPEQARPLARAQVGTLASPSLRSFLKHDPGPALRKTKVPVLALYGDRDLQVIADQNFEVARASLKEAGNPRSSAQLLTGLNHLFQTSVTGMPNEYGQIQETISPKALEAIAAWLETLAPKPPEKK